MHIECIFSKFYRTFSLLKESILIVSFNDFLGSWIPRSPLKSQPAYSSHPTKNHNTSAFLQTTTTSLLIIYLHQTWMPAVWSNDLCFCTLDIVRINSFLSLLIPFYFCQAQPQLRLEDDLIFFWRWKTTSFFLKI